MLTQIPPTDVLIKDMSIQFVKIWYVMNSNVPLESRSDIYVKMSEIYNTSLGNVLYTRGRLFHSKDKYNEAIDYYNKSIFNNNVSAPLGFFATTQSF